ncbi:FecR family protein [Gluconacetobacter entanii]|uniref:Histidine kinase n=2 Tax=Acetobacteraceae TaxID=433 RepID=A0A318PU74_9PROT|nr:FecR domain-containing protein [Gluconacetobacter entanii]PYD62625.1 histidine kinase [Gluconacetobacter entanii]
MTAGTESEDERATREATDWLIFLEDEPDDPDLRARFADWLSAHPANRKAWAETAQAYDLIGPAAVHEGAAVRVFEVRDLADEVAPRPSKRILSRRMVPVAGAGMALAACLALLIAPKALLWWQADYITGTAQQQSIRLADGTDVELAPQSAIAVDYKGSQRNIRLLKGRAFFEVTHDAARPFAVDAHSVRTTDIGTAFEVAFEADSTDVAVVQGAVQVDASPSFRISEHLQAGQAIRVGWTGSFHRANADGNEIAAWRHGQLIASDQPVSDVVEKLRPYFKGMIVLGSSDFAARRVTGVYDLNNPLGALHALVQAHEGVVVRRVTPWLVIISDF